MSTRPYTIIEVPFSGYPSIGGYGRRHLPRNQIYIALGQFDSELLFQQTQYWMDVMNDPYNDTGIRSVRQGEITNMPFGPDAADEIIVPEYFGNPFLADTDRARAAEQIALVLRPKGLLTVVEATNPGIVTASDVVGMLSAFGFHQQNAGHEYDSLAVAQYSDKPSATGYVAAFVLEGGA